MEENKNPENDNIADENSETIIITTKKVVDKKHKNKQSVNDQPLKGKSQVWNFFKKVNADNKVNTQCTINSCEEKLVYQSNTTNMMRHLKAHHTDAHEQFITSVQKTPSK